MKVNATSRTENFMTETLVHSITCKQSRSAHNNAHKTKQIYHNKPEREGYLSKTQFCAHGFAVAFRGY